MEKNRVLSLVLPVPHQALGQPVWEAKCSMAMEAAVQMPLSQEGKHSKTDIGPRLWVTSKLFIVDFVF